MLPNPSRALKRGCPEPVMTIWSLWSRWKLDIPFAPGSELSSIVPTPPGRVFVGEMRCFLFPGLVSNLPALWVLHPFVWGCSRFDVKSFCFAGITPVCLRLFQVWRRIFLLCEYGTRLYVRLFRVWRRVFLLCEYGTRLFMRLFQVWRRVFLPVSYTHLTLPTKA